MLQNNGRVTKNNNKEALTFARLIKEGKDFARLTKS